MSKEDQRRSSCKKRSGQSLQLFESPKRLRDSMAKKTRNSLKRSFHRALLGIKHEEATENAVHNGHNLPKQTQFNDLNRKCIEHIFAFLTLKDKLNFRKVCSAWKTMFKQLLRIVDLKVQVRKNEPRSENVVKIKKADFHKLLKIGGHHLRSITIEIRDCETNCLRGRINAEEYIITGQFCLCDFLNVIADVSTDIQFFSCFVSDSVDSSLYDFSFSDLMSKLIGENRKMRCYKMYISRPHARFINLRDLPESVEDVGINFFVEDTRNMCDWLTVAKNLRSLSFNDGREYDIPSSKSPSETDITSEMMDCVTHDRATNTKNLRLILPTSRTFVFDMERISVLKSLKNLHIIFPEKDEVIDDFLVALSSGCKNLKKLRIVRSTFTCKGLNRILNDLDLTHLSIEHCMSELHKLSRPRTTLQHLELRYLDIDAFGLTKLLRTFKNLRRISVFEVEITDKHIYDLCAACPRLKHVEINVPSDITDPAVHHLLTTLSHLTKFALGIHSDTDIIPPHIDDVRSNVRDVVLFSPKETLDFAQLKKLRNMRSLTLKFPERYPTKTEMEAICSGCEKLEELHFEQNSDQYDLDIKVAEEELNSLLQAKSNLQLATINIVPIWHVDDGEKITLKKQHKTIVRTMKINQTYYPSAQYLF